MTKHDNLLLCLNRDRVVALPAGPPPMITTVCQKANSNFRSLRLLPYSPSNCPLCISNSVNANHCSQCRRRRRRTLRSSYIYMVISLGATLVISLNLILAILRCCMFQGRRQALFLRRSEFSFLTVMGFSIINQVQSGPMRCNTTPTLLGHLAAVLHR